VPENRVRGLLVACGYRIPEPVVRQRTDQDPIKKPAPPPAAAKPPVPPEVIAGILKGAIYRQLGEEDDAYVVTTKAAFLREREAIRLILKSCPPPDRVSTLWCVKGGFANHNAVCGSQTSIKGKVRPPPWLPDWSWSGWTPPRVQRR
jgi:hypothetical protein